MMNPIIRLHILYIIRLHIITSFTSNIIFQFSYIQLFKVIDRNIID